MMMNNAELLPIFLVYFLLLHFSWCWLGSQMELAKVEAQRLVAEAAGKHAQEIAAERLRAEGLLAEIDRLKGMVQSHDQIEAEIRQR